MKPFSALRAFLQSGLLLAILITVNAGCASKPKPNWDQRVGNYTYDDAVRELGPPVASTKLQDGSTVAEWFLKYGWPDFCWIETCSTTPIISVTIFIKKTSHNILIIQIGSFQGTKIMNSWCTYTCTGNPIVSIHNSTTCVYHFHIFPLVFNKWNIFSFFTVVNLFTIRTIGSKFSMP